MDVTNSYIELQTTTNFSFLRGASHPADYVYRAAELKYGAIGITDFNSLAGVVRAHTAARQAGIQLCVGCRLEIDFQGEIDTPLNDRSSQYHQSSILIYPRDLSSYGTLCQLLSRAKSELSKNDFFINLGDFLKIQNEFITILIPPGFQTRLHTSASVTCSAINTLSTNNLNLFEAFARIIRDNAKDLRQLSIALTANYGAHNRFFIESAIAIAKSLSLRTVVTNDVYYHIPERKPLHDTLTAIRLGTTVEQAGLALFQNRERYLKSPQEMQRLFRSIPQAIERTYEIAEMISGFSLSLLTYTYPSEVAPQGRTPETYLRERVQEGAKQRYPNGIPLKVLNAIEEELKLIKELSYEKYFLTCDDIVSFARARGILCQGRGAAANSVVCFCLGITAVDPAEIDLLLARFVSKERLEPPDIDIDFEHERREEVIQYIYSRYGRDRAALTAEVVTFQARGAIRAVSKALGISLEITNILCKNIHRWTGSTISSECWRELGINPNDPTIQNTLALSAELIGFPRHLSQHVGGFIISDTPLNRIVPIINAGMRGRTIIEWDKNDIEELGMLKIDILALGMLTCIRKALEMINSNRQEQLQLYSIPQNDPTVYDMLCAADTIGVFQVESRAQMSMLPRLRPRCFYDLVIEVAIVRPGPIQGNMVHPFLRRRKGLEKPYYPDERVKRILGKTLGIPIFQEQAMRLAITLANFTPGEAEQLRRAMAAWKSSNGALDALKEKIINGMAANGYSFDFAQTCLNQIKGFSEYGFPESHAASFAHLVYASAWIKRHYPAQFACALLNSQPLGFYTPDQIIQDAKRHGVRVIEIDANHSRWDSSIEPSSSSTLRLGLRLVRGLRREHANNLECRVKSSGGYDSVESLWSGSQESKENKLSRATLTTLARADCFKSFGINRRGAHWQIQALPPTPAPLDDLFRSRSATTPNSISSASKRDEMRQDYAMTGFSLRAHPLQFIRRYLNSRQASCALTLRSQHEIKSGATVSIAGLATIRQRPGTAKGVVFITLEDESGSVNLIIRPSVFEKNPRLIMQSSILFASGKLERIGDLPYIDVSYLECLDHL